MKNRYYKVSINIGPFHYYQNSRVYEIADGRSTIVPGLFYSFVTIMLGWWSISLSRPLGSFRDSLEALHINFSGGEDISNLLSDFNYDEKTNYVWKNLLRNTIEKLSKDEVEIIIEIQEEFENENKVSNADENLTFIFKNLEKVGLRHIHKDEILDVLEAVKNFEKPKAMSNYEL